jgi:hypothetical protein
MPPETPKTPEPSEPAEQPEDRDVDTARPETKDDPGPDAGGHHEFDPVPDA